MPVDPIAVFEAIVNGLSKIPSGIVAALLLAGPTVVWLILRFANPRDARSRHGAVSADLHWICPECRSLNEDRSARCYRCFLLRADAVMPVLAVGAAADSIGVGIAVGPGLPLVPPLANWLEEDEEDEEVEEELPEAIAAGDDEPDPADELLAPALAVAAPEAAPIFEPLVLEPRAKVARRPSSPRPKSPRPSSSRASSSRTTRRG